jgi:hypothetical protein
MSDYPKRLIEVDLPIKEISAHARRDQCMLSDAGARSILARRSARTPRRAG